MAALVGVALLGVSGSPLHKKTRLGLDLQGGLEVVLQAVPPKGQKITQQGLDNAVTIMRNRVDKLGVAEPEIRKQGNDQIVIELPGVKNAAQAASLIGKTAQLEFFDLQADVTGPSVGTSGFVRYPVAASSLFNMLAGQQAKAKQGTPTGYYLFGKDKKIIAGPSETRDGLFTGTTKKVPKGGKVFAVPARHRRDHLHADRRATGARERIRTAARSVRPTTTSSSTTRRTRTRRSGSRR